MPLFLPVSAAICLNASVLFLPCLSKKTSGLPCMMATRAGVSLIVATMEAGRGLLASGKNTEPSVFSMGCPRAEGAMGDAFCNRNVFAGALPFCGDTFAEIGATLPAMTPFERRWRLCLLSNMEADGSTFCV